MLACLLVACGCGRGVGEPGLRVLSATPGFIPEVRIVLEGDDLMLDVPVMIIGTAPIEELDCTTCHTAFENFPAVHGAVREEQGCLGCHQVLADRHPVRTQLEFGLRAVGMELCVRCHEDKVDGFRQGAVQHKALEEEGSCSICHDPHVGASPALMRGSERDVCAVCHETHVTNLSSKPHVHAPARHGDCTRCHVPHSGERSFLLRQPYPSLIKEREYRREEVALCFECHDPALVEEASTLEATAFRIGDRNLHHEHVIKQGRTCRSCHEAHAGDQAHLIRSEVAYGSSGYALKIEYRESPSGGTCVKACHKERGYER